MMETSENANDDEEVRSDEEARSDTARPRRETNPPRNYEPSMDGKSYNFMQEDILCSTKRSMYSQAAHFLFNQMHASKGIKLYLMTWMSL